MDVTFLFLSAALFAAIVGLIAGCDALGARQ